MSWAWNGGFQMPLVLYRLAQFPKQPMTSDPRIQIQQRLFGAEPAVLHKVDRTFDLLAFLIREVGLKLGNVARRRITEPVEFVEDDTPERLAESDLENVAFARGVRRQDAFEKSSSRRSGRPPLRRRHRARE